METTQTRRVRRGIATEDNPIYQIRARLGLTQDQFAAALGCSKITARRFEYAATPGDYPKQRGVRRALRKLATRAKVTLPDSASTVQ